MNIQGEDNEVDEDQDPVIEGGEQNVEPEFQVDEEEGQELYNPEYHLEDIQERDQDGNLIQHNLNVVNT